MGVRSPPPGCFVVEFPWVRDRVGALGLPARREVFKKAKKKKAPRNLVQTLWVVVSVMLMLEVEVERCNVFQEFVTAEDSHRFETFSWRTSENERRGKKPQKGIDAPAFCYGFLFCCCCFFLRCVFVAQLRT